MERQDCKSLHPSSILGQASNFPLGKAPSEDLRTRNETDPNGAVRDSMSRPNPELCSAAVPRWSDWHRLRKYRRKKMRRAFEDRCALLYWRYHSRVYGPHRPLWLV
jgi:hypothetical protein